MRICDTWQAELISDAFILTSVTNQSSWQKVKNDLFIIFVTGIVLGVDDL